MLDCSLHYNRLDSGDGMDIMPRVTKPLVWILQLKIDGVNLPEDNLIKSDAQARSIGRHTLH